MTIPMSMLVTPAGRLDPAAENAYRPIEPPGGGPFGDLAPPARTRSDRDTIEVMRQEVAGEIAMFEKQFPPRNLYESRVVEIAARWNLRAIRLIEAQEELSAFHVSQAFKRFDEAMEDRVFAELSRLQIAPMETITRLRRTSAGCRLLAGEWSGVANAIRSSASGRLPAQVGRKVFHLIGLADAPTFLASDEDRRLGAAIKVLSGAPEGSADPLVAAARDLLIAAAEERRRKYNERADQIWRDFDGPARAAAPITGLFDKTPDGRLLARWIAEATRNCRRCLDELAKLEKGTAQARSQAAPKRTDRPRATEAANRPTKTEPTVLTAATAAPIPPAESTVTFTPVAPTEVEPDHEAKRETNPTDRAFSRNEPTPGGSKPAVRRNEPDPDRRKARKKQREARRKARRGR